MYINYVHPEERLYVDMYDNRGYLVLKIYTTSVFCKMNGLLTSLYSHLWSSSIFRWAWPPTSDRVMYGDWLFQN